ncbi:nickel pincer cofactor biosynthesis protein LarC [Candidatus Saganbacteria bacterium]|nr:nickel pincer cofactor biosynthesis protein LarC [Candidatus Saganbacteria bacterium]
MKIAYFDCSAGMAGNMMLGALLDAGLDQTYLQKELLKLQTSNIQLQNKYQIIINKCQRNAINGTYFDVKIEHEHHHRGLKDILKIINRSKLSKQVKKLSARIFRRLAAAESKMHDVPINQIHFHEVGAVDAIIDIVGTCIGLEKLGIEKVYCSPIPFGKGTIKHAHGILPNPAPATAELLMGVPIYQENVTGELVTPTGAAIITTIAEDFINLPRLELERCGYGAGSNHYTGLTGFLALYIGEAKLPAKRDTVLQIEANIDDTNPKLYDQIIASLMKAGALDVAIISIIMKKKRAGISLVVICRPQDREQIIAKIFELTTTFGVKTFIVPRETLNRHLKTVKTKYGKARVKIGTLGQKVVTIAPEYEDYKRLAEKHNIPIKRSYKDVFYSSFTL